MTARDSARLLIHSPQSGDWNMAIDELLLAEAADRDECCLRFYQWSEPTLSLGYFQPYATRAAHPESRSCAAVRRSTGGGAIVHDHELTYSFAVNIRHPLAEQPPVLYRLFHSALVAALAPRGAAAALGAPNSKALPSDEPFLCFERRAEGDLLLGQYKIGGSAQRRHRGAILQHGSVLLDRSAEAPQLPGIAQLTKLALTPQQLIALWQPRLAEALHIDWRHDELTARELATAEHIVQEKHGNIAWIKRR